MLRRKLITLRNLTTFSFFVHGHSQWFAPIGFWLRHHDIYELVNHLPASVTSLEIDTKGFERTTSKDAREDICTVVSSRLKNLQHLRLQLSRYCNNFFGPSSTLKSMTITTILPKSRTESQQCGRTDYEQTEGPETREPQGRETRQMLVDRGLEMLPQLPSLRKFLIIDAEGEREKHTFPIVVIRDLMVRKTLSLPLLYMGLESEEAAKMMLRYPDKDGEEQDVVGNIGDMEQLFEGPAWVATVEGSRFPAEYKESPQGRKHRWSEGRKYETKEEFIERKEMMGLWGDEQHVGMKLVHARETEGVGEVEALRRLPSELDDEESESESEMGEEDGVDWL